jgi:hypothetical protein
LEDLEDEEEEGEGELEDMIDIDDEELYDIFTDVFSLLILKKSEKSQTSSKQSIFK